jgi:hypothetical protein
MQDYQIAGKPLICFRDFIKVFQIKKFIKENHANEDIIHKWINGALTTAIYGRP